MLVRVNWISLVTFNYQVNNHNYFLTLQHILLVFVRIIKRSFKIRFLSVFNICNIKH
jgi:hypothetical protein